MTFYDDPLHLKLSQQEYFLHKIKCDVNEKSKIVYEILSKFYFLAQNNKEIQPWNSFIIYFVVHGLKQFKSSSQK